jgi:PAS domain S-box-containing protein
VPETKEHAMAVASHKILQLGRGSFLAPIRAFAALKACVIGGLVQRATAAKPARIWVPGCGGGHDAYSIALLLIERAIAGGHQPNFKIFATDARGDLISVARTGYFLEEELANISAERRAKFFRWRGINRYQVNSQLRSHVVFAPHDLTCDPPLSRLDLVCCRDILAVITPELQGRVIDLLHFALNDGGHLLLGSGDSIGPSCELFEPLSLEGKLYRRVGTGPRRLPNSVVCALTQARAKSAVASCRSIDEPCTGGSKAAAASELVSSAREELQVSKEELQCLNEELMAVNSELAANVDELDSAFHDMMELMASSNVCIVFLDTGLYVRRFTSPASPLLGLQTHDIGRLCGAVMKGLDDELSLDARLAIDRGSVVEKNVRTRDGRCYLRRIQPHQIGSERFGGALVTYVDITSQIATDSQLRRFAAVLRDSEDAILVVNFHGSIKAWNRGAERLYGYTEIEALQMNMRELTAGEHAEGTLDAMRRVAGGEVVSSFDSQRRTRDGRMIDVSATVSLLLDDAGNPESLATTERNITTRLRAEEATRKLNARLERRVAERATELQHSEDQIRAILDATADAVVTIDILGRIATFNRAAERIFGYSSGEVIGESVAILIPPYERGGRFGYKEGATRGYLSRLTGRSHELSARRKDGSLFPIQLSVNAVEGRELFVGVARDMTEHKALQKEIIDVAMLEQRRIGQELHDGTQQELTGLGLLALSLAETLSRNGAETAGQIAARVARGIELANQRVRSLARGMVPVPIDREGLMTALAELARQTAEIHGLPCGFECPAPVEIDNDNEATHFYRIAQEAVSNATRHAKASAIWIRLEQVDGHLVLEVQDDGIGLQTSDRPVKGVGLRLMEHRCAMIGGTFVIGPRQDGGTCIACTVPRADNA